MNTHLSAKMTFSGEATIQRVENTDSLIGKKIKTNQDFEVVSLNKNNTSQINIKGKTVVIEDVIRTCGLQLFCNTEEQQTFCLYPTDLEQFEEI